MICDTPGGYAVQENFEAKETSTNHHGAPLRKLRPIDRQTDWTVDQRATECFTPYPDEWLVADQPLSFLSKHANCERRPARGRGNWKTQQKCPRLTCNPAASIDTPLRHKN